MHKYNKRPREKTRHVQNKRTKNGFLNGSRPKTKNNNITPINCDGHDTTKEKHKHVFYTDDYVMHISFFFIQNDHD
jgi:hypothetical protein